MAFIPFNQDYSIGAVTCYGSVLYTDETSVPTHIRTYRKAEEYTAPYSQYTNYFNITDTTINITDNRTGSVYDCDYLTHHLWNTGRSRIFQQNRILKKFPSGYANSDGRIAMRWGVDFDVPGALLSKINADPTQDYPAETIDGTITLLTSGLLYEGATDSYTTTTIAFPLDKKLITRTLDVNGDPALDSFGYPLIRTTWLYIQQAIVPVTPPTCTGTCGYWKSSNTAVGYGFRFTINVGSMRFKTTSNGNKSFSWVQS